METYNIKNNPLKIQYEITNRAKKLENDLYILSKGNNFDFDFATRQALQSLCTTINFYVLDKRG